MGVYLSHPKQTKAIASARLKSDKVDAEEHCNWLQRAENSVDQSHLIALHGPENKEGVKMKNQPFKIGVCALPVFLFVMSCAPSIFEAGREIMSGRDALLQDF